MLRRRAPAAALLALLLAVGACSHDGRELAPVRAGQTTTTEPPPTLPAAGIVPTLRSDAFADAAEIPERYTCFGDGVSPGLSWSNLPYAAELAIVVRDRDAGGYVHWIVTGIDPTITGFGDAGVPEGAVEQANSTGAVGYEPPCPPEGNVRHIYDFTLHILDAPVTIDPSLPAAEVATFIETTSSSEATLAGTVTVE